MPPDIRCLRPLAVVASLVAGLCASPPTAAGLTLVGETAAGAFVTMTRGARCPSTMTVTFLSQGEASGTLEGRHDEQGSLLLALDEAAGTSTIAVFASTFAINETAARGVMTWKPEDGTLLALSCDPLSLRIEGEVRYQVAESFVESGTARIQIWGTRERITEPYFGHFATTFSVPARTER